MEWIETTPPPPHNLLIYIFIYPTFNLLQFFLTFQLYIIALAGAVTALISMVSPPTIYI